MFEPYESILKHDNTTGPSQSSSTFLSRLVPLYHRINESGTCERVLQHDQHVDTYEMWDSDSDSEMEEESSKTFDIVYVGSDPTEREYNDFVSTMPWSSIPYLATSSRERLRRDLGVSRLPTLMIVNAKDGQIVCMNAQLQVLTESLDKKKPTGFPWGELTISPKEEGISYRGHRFCRPYDPYVGFERGVRARSARILIVSLKCYCITHSYHCALECDE